MLFPVKEYSGRFELIMYSVLYCWQNKSMSWSRMRWREQWFLRKGSNHRSYLKTDIGYISENRTENYGYLDETWFACQRIICKLSWWWMCWLIAISLNPSLIRSMNQLMMVMSVSMVTGLCWDCVIGIHPCHVKSMVTIRYEMNNKPPFDNIYYYLYFC